MVVEATTSLAAVQVLHATRASATMGGILHPRQWRVAARSGAASNSVDEWQPDDGRLGSRPCRPRSRIGSFLLLKIVFSCQLI
jgi:hypothetical protein